MNSLQLSLIGLGAAAVGAVWGYNAWQVRRQRRVAEDLIGARRADVLLADKPSTLDADAAPRVWRSDMAEPRIEPGLAAPSERASAPTTASEAPPKTAPYFGEQPVVDDVPRFGTPAVVTPAHFGSGALDAPAVSLDAAALSGDGFEVLLPPHLLAPSVDYIAAFESMEPVAGDQIMQWQGQLLRLIGKRIGLAGFNDQENVWEVCRDGTGYRRIRIGAQLADRNGPLGEPALDAFHDAMQCFADEITAVADLPPKRAALEAARRLDAVCAQVDIQVGVNVISGAVAFQGTKIRALAEAAGLVIGTDGAYVRRDEEGNLLWSLLAHGAPFRSDTMRTLSLNGLTFLLDVPRVANGDRVFNHMVEVARRFAETLQGQLVDDNRRPITEQFLTPIRRQIAQFQATMGEQGLPAGSPVAQRLFA